MVLPLTDTVGVMVLVMLPDFEGVPVPLREAVTVAVLLPVIDGVDAAVLLPVLLPLSVGVLVRVAVPLRLRVAVDVSLLVEPGVPVLEAVTLGAPLALPVMDTVGVQLQQITKRGLTCP